MVQGGAVVFVSGVGARMRLRQGWVRAGVAGVMCRLTRDTGYPEPLPQ